MWLKCFLLWCKMHSVLRKAIFPFQRIQVKVETVLVLEVLAFKIWKILYKKLYRYERFKSNLIFNQKHYSGKY